MNLRRTHATGVASVKAGFSRATGYRIPAAGARSAEPPARRGRRRPDPLAGIFEAEVVPILKNSPGIRPVAGFEEPTRRHPELDRGVRRTVERRVRSGRAEHGPEQEVIFPQKQPPGRAGASRTSFEEESRRGLRDIHRVGDLHLQEYRLTDTVHEHEQHDEPPQRVRAGDAPAQSIRAITAIVSPSFTGGVPSRMSSIPLAGARASKSSVPK